MKLIKLLASAALVASSISPLAISPAYAVPADGTTEGRMQTTCTTNLTTKGINPAETLHSGGLRWSTEFGSVVETDETTVETSRDIDESSRFGTGPVLGYSMLSIAQNAVSADKPYRTGGSVNMFGDQIAKIKNWSNSEYDYLGHYKTTTNYSFVCDVTEATEVFHEAVYGPDAPGGSYTNNGTNPSGGGGSCQGLNPHNPNWGTSFGNCVWHPDGTTIPGELLEEAYWEPTGETPRPDLGSTGTDSQIDLSTAPGHETNGGPFAEQGNWFVGQVVICISPKKLPGTWTKQNGYAGVNCTTSWFNQAPWGGGSQDSKGTYISVPGV